MKDADGLDLERLTTVRRPLVTRVDNEFIRVRLAKDLHERYFHRIGLQALPVEFGPKPGTLLLASPFCSRQPTFFGKIATSEIASTSSYQAELGYEPHKVGGRMNLVRDWLSWSQLITEVISVLGLNDGYLEGHGACHHRSARSFYPFMFDLGIHLACRPTGEWKPDISFEWVRAATHAGSFAEMLGVPIDRWGRHLAIYDGNWRGLLLRNDGLVSASSGDTFDAHDAWLRGATVADVKAELERFVVP